MVGGTHATYEPLLIDVNTMFFGFDLKGMPVITMLATRSINYDTHTQGKVVSKGKIAGSKRGICIYTQPRNERILCATFQGFE